MTLPKFQRFKNVDVHTGTMLCFLRHQRSFSVQTYEKNSEAWLTNSEESGAETLKPQQMLAKKSKKGYSMLQKPPDCLLGILKRNQMECRRKVLHMEERLGRYFVCQLSSSPRFWGKIWLLAKELQVLSIGIFPNPIDLVVLEANIGSFGFKMDSLSLFFHICCDTNSNASIDLYRLAWTVIHETAVGIFKSFFLGWEGWRAHQHILAYLRPERASDMKIYGFPEPYFEDEPISEL